jgi:hypothetical protein
MNHTKGMVNYLQLGPTGAPYLPVDEALLEEMFSSLKRAIVSFCNH